MIKIQLQKNMRTTQGVQLLDVDMTINSGEFITLFGESGAGKTTLLRMIAGLTEPDSGHLAVDGVVWFDREKKINRPVQERRVGFVSPEHSLFPNMTILENLRYAFQEKNRLHQTKQIIEEWLEIMDLKVLALQKPHQLSQGQKQRVALARAMVSGPKVLLFDEPLSALDASLRMKLQDEFFNIHQKTKITTLWVSHDLSEVWKLSGRIFVLDHGKIIKSGSPRDLFHKDVSGKFKFLGKILEMTQDGVVFILTIQIGLNVTKVVASEGEVQGMRLGDEVMVAVKAFNPLVMKCSQ